MHLRRFFSLGLLLIGICELHPACNSTATVLSATGGAGGPSVTTGGGASGSGGDPTIYIYLDGSPPDRVLPESE